MTSFHTELRLLHARPALREAAHVSEKTKATKARRRSRKKEATPPWADRDRIESIYDCAGWISYLTETAHVVDHIVPLFADNVCGLHWHENLQVITAEANAKKGNKFKTQFTSASSVADSLSPKQEK